MNEVADIPLKIIVDKLCGLAPDLKALGVTRLSLFGSRVRGDARPDSDLDVLIETTPHDTETRFDYFRVQHLIEDRIGLRTHVAQRELLKQRIAARISDDLIEVF